MNGTCSDSSYRPEAMVCYSTTESPGVVNFFGIFQMGIGVVVSLVLGARFTVVAVQLLYLENSTGFLS